MLREAEVRLEEVLRAEDSLPETVPEPILRAERPQGLRRDRVTLPTEAALLTAERVTRAEEEKEDFV